ncbi:class I SAM-dependent methyltransferase [Acinetobacter tianfuensis]|uniref:Class I SAM-dependent methyltransferase n=1 Tax=Acinetobacter tianfuensis TaxID=2419603 RepID=A0A3A8E7L1_9GAMM|nr:class I SAM-dependent methyltransferase [Acinetobacter tianfuensis]RKG30605.1 class I SAM-dependent methyltransferase [Acinetobacter tianfuensis]
MAKDFDSEYVVAGYDEHIRKLIPAYEQVHAQLLALMQAHLPVQARVLIIGAGTGYELGCLMQAFPQAQFTVTELSQTMLTAAEAHVKPWNGSARVQFILGSHTQLPQLAGLFDAVLSILVTHFVPFAEKQLFFKSALTCLKQDGLFVTYDLMQRQSMLETMALQKRVQQQGLSEQQSQKMLERLEDDFYALDAHTTVQMLKQAGFDEVSAFMQVLCYQGFCAKRPEADEKG